MDTDKQKKLEGFILKQLKDMETNLTNSYEKNKLFRAKNPFLCFSPGLDKFMGLGRSIDSQLGSRMQNIIFYLCKTRYGFPGVPNIVVINVRQESQEVILDTYYTDAELDVANFYSVKNPCTQKIYFNQEISADRIKRLIGTKKRVDIIKKQSFRFPATTEQIDYLIGKKQQIQPVDLLVVDTSKENPRILTFEIKMSGNLDTKNAESNAKEVQDLFQIFDFLPEHASYFAVCYGECSEAVSNHMNNDAPDGNTLDETAFWNLVLPNKDTDTITYQEFKDIYKKTFIASELEKTIAELDT